MPPPLPPRPVSTTSHKPHVILYHQTHYNQNQEYVSILPLITEATSEIIPLTHLIVAAIHLNEPPGNITLNDDPPSQPKHDQLWKEAAILQDIGVKVLGMLGGAAKGSFERLDGNDEAFENYYVPLRDMIRLYKLDGLDLDVEEEMSLAGIIRLIDRLKADFGPQFIITLAPVATALQGRQHLSGFDYEALEVMRGSSIEWYNAQFYNGWGRLESFVDFDAILQRGWRTEKVVVGVLTSSRLGHGYVDFEEMKRTVGALGMFYEGFGGVMGWEYFCASPGGEEEPWRWAGEMMGCLRGG